MEKAFIILVLLILVGSCPREAFAAINLPIFTTSNSDFTQKLNSFYKDMMTGKLNGENESDDSHSNNRIFDPSWTLWREWQAMSTAYLNDDGVRNANKVFLQNIKIDDSGFVYNGYSEDEIGWIFPNYQDSYGKSTGWEFNQPGNLEGWIPERIDQIVVQLLGSDGNIGITTTITQPDPKLQNENLSIDSINCPFIRLRVASQLNDNNLDFYFITDQEQGWSEDKKITQVISNNGSWNTYNLLVYKNPKWRGMITGLSLDIARNGGTRPGLAGPYAGIDSIRCAYDTRHSIDNTAYILGAWQYYLWTKDEAFLTSMLPKLRKVINFLGTEFQGDSLEYLQNPWWGHEGTTGIDSAGNRMPGHGIGSNWHDLLPFGGKDGYLTSYYYRALKAMSDLDPDSRQTYLNKADLVKQVSDTKFWNSVTRRFAPIIDINNQSHDYGYTFANLEMLYNGLGDADKADSIFSWLDGNPDIYKPVFAPRLSTERNNDWYMWQAVKRDWGQQIQDGGAALYYSYYDVMDRLKYKGADNAFNRFKTIVDWWDEVKTAGGVRKYYENGAGKNLLSQFWRLQGCGTDGGIGLDCEFPENVIVPTAFLYGFLGIEPQIDGLHIKPDLPSSLSFANVENIYHWGSVYNLKAAKHIREVTITNSGGIYQVNVPADKETIIANGSCVLCYKLPTPIPPTATPIPTNTPIPPTATPIPTDTPVPPTSTPIPTDTPVPPTNTPIPTATPIPPSPTPTPLDFPTFLNLFKTYYNQPNPPVSVDLNGDRITDIFDYNRFLTK